MLICLSASHRNAGFDLLEKLSVAGERTTTRIVESDASLRGAVVVATCNRFEAYLDLEADDGDSPIAAIHNVIRSVGAETSIDAEELRATFDLVHGNAVAAHLFSVASGLESVVVGEGEIAGQVRRSLGEARSHGTTTPELERLFQRASQTSRSVKNRTGLGSAGRSLVRLALDLAESRITDWRAARILLVGTGQYAGASLAALRDRGGDNVRVYSPSGRAERFAANHQLNAVTDADFARETALADVIVTCTTADHHVLTADILRAGHAAPPHGLHAVTEPEPERRLVIDLGLPRNVDPNVTEITGVELLDLETIRIHAPLEARGATDDARAIVKKATKKFQSVREELDLTHGVVALRSHVFDVLDAEIERAASRGDDDGRTEAALRHMAGVLLHTPMVRSREYARANQQKAWLDGIEAVFGIDVSTAEASGSNSKRDSAAS